MRRMRDQTVTASAVLAMLLATGLAGCILAPVHDPDDAPRPWAETEAPVWVVYTTGCGMCYEAPHATATALHTDGTLVVFEYTGNRSYHYPSEGEPEADPHKTTDPTGTVRTYRSHADHLAAFLPTARILAETDTWWASSLPLHVEGHWVGRLGPSDMDRVDATLKRALGAVGPQAPPESGCTDTAFPHVSVRGEARWDLPLNDDGHCSKERNSQAWQTVIDQMRTLRDWMETQETRTHP